MRIINNYAIRVIYNLVLVLVVLLTVTTSCSSQSDTAIASTNNKTYSDSILELETLTANSTVSLSLRDGQYPALAEVFNSVYYFDKLKTENGSVKVKYKVSTKANQLVITDLETKHTEMLRIVKSYNVSMFRLENNTIYALPFYIDHESVLTGAIYARVYNGKLEVFSVKLTRADDIFVIFALDEHRI